MEAGVNSTLRDVAGRYPAELIPREIKDIPRIAFNIGLACKAEGRDIRDLEICDLGGGVGMFSVGCAALGARRSVLVDDFSDAINHEVGDGLLDIHRSYGVAVVSRDVVKQGIADLEGRFDAITSFDSMEHWHDSPKRLFAQVAEKLKPGGVFVLGVPNCVNLRKRITVPLGRGKWSAMSDWYEVPDFRGHVREPDVGDLRYIARDMGLQDVRIHGRNWAGYYSPKKAIRLATSMADRGLRIMPALCSDIYLTGRRPA